MNNNYYSKNQLYEMAILIFFFNYKVGTIFGFKFRVLKIVENIIIVEQ